MRNMCLFQRSHMPRAGLAPKGAKMQRSGDGCSAPALRTRAEPRSSRHVRPSALRTPETSETVGEPLGQTVLSLVTGKVLQLPQRGRWVEISELNTNVHPSCWGASLCSELSMAFYVSNIRGLVVV